MEDLERYEYQDEGCDLFPSCLNCPLPRCRYDEPSRRQMRKQLRNREIMRLHMEGKGIKELGERFGISKRTVHRILASTTCHSERSEESRDHSLSLRVTVKESGVKYE